MEVTKKQYLAITNQCRTLFENKMADYGAAWRILRLPSLTDQIFIKAQRIRSLQTNKEQKVAESQESEFIGIVNYSVMALILIEKGIADKPDFDKAIARVKGMALTDAARNKKLIEVYKKYGRKAPISLVKPVGKKGGGKVAISKKKGGKMKSKGYNSGGKVKQEKALELKKKAGSKTTQNKKKRTKDNDLFGMLSGLGYQKGTMPGDTFKAGGKIKSKGYKAGGKMKSKGYKAGGKMKNNSQSGHNRLY